MCCRWTKAATSLLVVLWVLMGGAMPVWAAPATVTPAYGAMYGHGYGEELYLSLYLSAESMVGAAEGDQGVSFVFSRGADGRFSLVTKVAGKVVGFAGHRGDRLVFTEAGDWRVIFAGGSIAGLELPDNARVRSLAGLGTQLFAVGRVRGQSRLYRYESKWEDLGELPVRDADSEVRADVVAVLGAVAGKLYLVVGDGLQGVDFFEWDGQASDVSGMKPAGSADVGFAVREAEVLDLAGKVGVWVSPGEGGGGVILRGPPEFAVADRIDLGKVAGEVAVAGSRIRFFHGGAEAGSDQYETVYDMSGKLVGPPLKFVPPIMGGAQVLVFWFQLLVLLGLGVAIAVSFYRRSETREATEAYLLGKTRLHVAPLMKRLGAGVIDGVPFTAVLVYMGSTSVMGSPEEWIADPTPVLLGLAGAVVSALHVAVGELITGKSIGKAVFGLRVLTLAGEKAGVWAVVVRNVLRITDYLLVIPLITMVISPLRQRVGDSAAGTVVVDDSPPDEVSE